MPSLHIGDLLIANPVALAPMSGVTDIIFRRIAARLGTGLVVSEMVASGELVTGKEEARLRMDGEGISPHVVQLAGREPRWMAEAARLAEAAGADVIDINMGCPAKKVTGGYSGAALLKDLDLAAAMIEATVAAVAVPVTVKMRLGWDENSIVAPILARRAVGLGARLITVHGRTRSQFYNGTADWSAIAKVVEAVTCPVIANGDVTSPENAKDILAISGASGVMIGRGAQGRAWLPGLVARHLAGDIDAVPPSLNEQFELAIEHYEGLLSLYGVEIGVRHARKHLDWYVSAAAETCGAAFQPELRARLMTAASPRDARTALREAFDSLGWRAAA
ncbi:tRNA-dihydrouridine synthase [Agaricicola taiwanensis]|uniref:tRNA-dihydrouridine synthase n=1 Tax=Agaricicola taiwanensis TaxID=591372 RepID=A0A8J3DXC2_9RHOB|nr:tRNA dihydrouridine synthase DusB [Agaricicola taiwanensis]GGE45432.1 tRNA-dihydrouridine synthase [Agaricicola taiwanensis]